MIATIGFCLLLVGYLFVAFVFQGRKVRNDVNLLTRKDRREKAVEILSEMTHLNFNMENSVYEFGPFRDA